MYNNNNNNNNMNKNYQLASYPANVYPPPNMPYVVVQPMTIEDQINYRRRVYAMNKEYMERMLKERFPVVYLMIHSVILILISLVLIALQIVLIVKNGALNYVGTGIWGGCIGIILATVYIFLILKRSYSLYRVTLFLTPFSAFIFGVAFIMISTISLNKYDFCGSSIFFQPIYSCFNKEMIPVHYVMIALGIILIIMCVVYGIVMSVFYLTGRDAGYTRGVAYSRNQPVYMYNTNANNAYGQPQQASNVYPNL